MPVSLGLLVQASSSTTWARTCCRLLKGARETRQCGWGQRQHGSTQGEASSRGPSQPAAGRGLGHKGSLLRACSSLCPVEVPDSGTSGTAGPLCMAAAASCRLNKLVCSQNVSSLDGRRDSGRLYYFLVTLGSLHTVSTTISCPVPISSEAWADRCRPPSLGRCFRRRNAAAPLRSSPSALQSPASCSAGEKAHNSCPSPAQPSPAQRPLAATSSKQRPTPRNSRAGAARRRNRTPLRTSPDFAAPPCPRAAYSWSGCAWLAEPRPRRVLLASAAAVRPAPPPYPGRDSPGRGTGPAAQPASSPLSRQRRSPGAALIVPPAPGTMDELDQSPLISSSGPPRPQQPQFNYQFVLDDEKEEDEEEEEEEEDEDFDEQLEVMERKPIVATQERPSPPQDRSSPAEPPRPAAPEPAPEPLQPAWCLPQPAASSSSSSAASTPSPGTERPAPPQPEPRRRVSSSGSAGECLSAPLSSAAPRPPSAAFAGKGLFSPLLNFFFIRACESLSAPLFPMLLVEGGAAAASHMAARGRARRRPATAAPLGGSGAVQRRGCWRYSRGGREGPYCRVGEGGGGGLRPLEQ